MIAHHIVPTTERVHVGGHPVEGYVEHTTINITPGFHRDAQGNLVSNTPGHDEFRDTEGTLVSCEPGVLGEYRNARGDLLRSARITRIIHTEVDPVQRID